MLYAIGDIHGRTDELRRVLALVRKDAALHRLVKPRVVFLGDYVDRGLDSRGVLDALIELQSSGEFDPVFLRGNHEDMMMSGEAGNEMAGLEWLQNGGAETVESYGVLTGPRTPNYILLDFYAEFPGPHRAFVSELKLRHREAGFFFCHAGIDPTVSLDAQDRRTLMWGNRHFLNSDDPLPEIVVHGHWTRDAVVVRSNRIGIDTGAGYLRGRLTAVALKPGAVRELAGDEEGLKLWQTL